MQISSALANRQLDAPPYSPTAAASEQGRLPHDYLASPLHDDEDEDIDPLQSLARVKTTISTNSSHAGGQSSSRSTTPRSPLSPTQSFTTFTPLAHFVTAPPSFDAPPSYSACDALASSFRLQGSLIFATKTSSTPRYQLLQQFSRRGEPRKLHIRRLMPTESRRYSVPNLDTVASSRRIDYDEEGTMYTMTRLDNMWSKTAEKTYEMRGLRSSTLGGIVTVEAGKSVLGKKWVKVWHATKSRRKDSLNPENEERLQRYGYHAEDEWERVCLWTVRVKKGVGVWVDGEGRRVAMEEQGPQAEGKRFEVVGVEEAWKKDLMVACWVMKVWMGGLRWDGDELGR